MTINHRDVAHRIIKARQFPIPDRPGRGNEGAATESAADPGTTDAAPSTPNGPNFTRPTTSPTPTPTTTPTPTPPAANPTTTTTTQTTPTTPPANAIASTTSTTSSATTESTTSTSTTTGTTSLTTLTQTSNTSIPSRVQTNTSINTLTRTLSSIGTSSTAAPTSTETSPSSSSGSNVGGIVGGIAGALVGIAILGFLVSFIIRRWRKRNNRDSIYGDDFRQSQFVSGSSSPLEPPVMGERGHSIAPSFSSGPGMAGHGAFQTGPQNPNAAGYGTGAGATGGYGTDAAAYGAGAAGYGAAAAIRERPNYTYGQQQQQQNYYNATSAPDDDGSDIAHGVYSAQPQPQVSYNPEAYGSYAAYDTTTPQAAHQNAPAHVGYQDATRQQYQGEDAYTHPGHVVGSEFSQPLYNPYVGAPEGAAGAGAAPAASGSGSSVPTVSPTPRDPVSVTGNRSVNTRSIVQDDDVYGGI